MMRGIMTYDSQNDSWMVESNGSKYNLFCGEIFKLVIGQRKILCRLELGLEWYVILDEGIKFNLRSSSTYQIYI